MPRNNSQPKHDAISNTDTPVQVGVGLRHAHFRDALSGASSSIDFVEIHAENFFAAGGLTPMLLKEISDAHPVSLHATSLGLGSATGINPDYLTRLERLVEQTNPWLVSDHACFSWSKLNGNHGHTGNAGNINTVHAGDLLPLEFTQQALSVLACNVDQVQQRLGRPILIENISSYIAPDNSIMSETEFLLALVERTQCRLLIDLNNLLVNAHNFGSAKPSEDAERWLQHIPAKAIGEFHLAGSTPTAPQSLLIDDHAQPVSDECWQLYRFAIERFGPVPTLIEWDNNLPSWEVLLEQADLARRIIETLHPNCKGQPHAN